MFALLTDLDVRVEGEDLEGIFSVGDETIEDQFSRIAVDVLDHLQRLLVLLQTPEVVQELLPATRLDSEAAKR